MPTPGPVLQACAVRKEFEGGVVALAGVDLDVGAGEWLAVTGGSGSGKTTLLHLFAALDKPTSGRILHRGEDVEEIDPDAYRRFSIGMVFQLHNLLAHLDVRDNIEIAMLGSHLSRRERAARVDRLVGEVGLEDQQLRRPPQLSGGERQRAAIARALANDPQVLLADEPTGSLDRAHVSRLMELLGDRNRRSGMAIVMVTHDAEVASEADRLVRLEGGRLVEVEEGRRPSALR